MDPFLRNRSWYTQPDNTHRRSFPHYPPGGAAAHTIKRPPGPKVVQIPVHYVGSEPVDRSGSALKIQKVFRGFLVRKSMRRIKDVKKQVDEIREKLSKREEAELIRRDERARLRTSEGLMSLLLKLDSIRGFDLGVRDCRKAVIREAIALQEKIDAIVAVNSAPRVEDAGTKVQESEIRASVETHCSNQSEDKGKLEGYVEMLDESGKDFEDLLRIGSDDGEIETIVDVGVVGEVKVGEANGTTSGVDSAEECLNENCAKNGMGDWVELEGDKEVKGHGYVDNKRNKALMDWIVRDNEKMMNMMTQLFESNEKQMRMINALSHRVEMLEKALAAEKEETKEGHLLWGRMRADS